ncbi:RNA-directed DNA polymerase from mobile element jockey [Trichonephila clavipes]|uniref:RNA-directed DNA polymerase from mobile element jockey n=1 Tax=Trichonephila clavipes TaxID=2585209 RepID=A0A8X6RM41_TRICX|nr:RNA-directed DNA polymerase from mobile element jockey [Trichonephila clavipes]
MDATAVQIKINNFPPINVVSAYVRRRAGHSFPVEDFKKIFNSGSNCIIAGDYNAAHVSWHNAKSTRFGQALHKLIRDLRGAKLVAPQTATHLQSRQRFGSVIDLAVFKHIPFNHSVRVINDLSSDHYPVILEINLNTSIIKNPEYLSTNWYNFKFALNKKPLPTVELTSNDNIELAISELNQNFTEAFVEASKPKFNNAPKILSPRLNSKFINETGYGNFGKELGALVFILNSVPSVTPTTSRFNPVQIFGQPVPWVRVAKYLGLFLDAKLTFAHHIEQTRKKAQAVHAVLKRLISRRSKLAIRHKVLLYKSIIRPVMSYGSQIWGSAGMCHLKKLHTLTNSFLRQIVNAPWFVRNEVIYRDLKIKPFLPHIKNLSKRFFDKLPSVPNELIRNQPAYDPAVPSSQKRPRALLEHDFINFPQAKRLRV